MEPPSKTLITLIFDSTLPLKKKKKNKSIITKIKGTEKKNVIKKKTNTTMRIRAIRKENKKARLFCLTDIRSYTCLKDYTVLKPGKLKFILIEYKVTCGTTYFYTITV